MTRQLPNVYVFIGIFLVLASVVVPAIRKMRKAYHELQRHKMNEEMEAIHNELYDEDEEALPLLDDHGDQLLPRD